MSTAFEDQLLQHHSALITDSEFAILISGSSDRRYALIKRALANGTLLRIRRGLYVIKYHLKTKPPHPFELAQFIYGLSYISLESALSAHGLIPEAVYSTTSVTIKRKKNFDTPLGVFSYLHLPVENFFTEVDYVDEGSNQYFLATPWKALLDYLYCYKKAWRDLSDAAEDLRLNLDALPGLTTQQANDLQCYYQRDRVTRFLRKIPEG
ncbi:MAG: hypothetical protein P1U40_02655 [Coxiellaceae bacterium]|nr:hypothetical protein [Coxiellaceae bacterium]